MIDHLFNHLVEKLIEKEWRGKKILNKYFGLVAFLIIMLGKCKIIHGRPRHPQSQGLIEQSNGTMKVMLVSILLEEKTDNWPSLLPKIMFNLNTQKHS